MSKHARHLFFILLAIDGAFLLLHIFFGKKLDLFNLDREYNFPTYWSGIQLVALAALSAGIAFIMRERRIKIFWGLFAAFFLYLAFDDISEIHEHITYYVSRYIQPSKYFRSPTYMWLVLFSPFILSAFALLVIFVRKIRMFMQERILALLGITCFVLALGLEFSGAFIHSKAYLRWEVVFEEGLELLGVTIFIAILATIARREFLDRFQEKTIG